MSFRNLDEADDWTWGQSLGNYVYDDMEILLNAKTRILSFLGDCFFAPAEGIDWWHLFNYNKQDELENAVMATIAQTPGVETVNNVESYMTGNRKINLAYSITTVNGTTYQQNLIPVI